MDLSTAIVLHPGNVLAWLLAGLIAGALAGRLTRVTVFRDSCSEACSYFGPQ